MRISHLPLAALLAFTLTFIGCDQSSESPETNNATPTPSASPTQSPTNGTAKTEPKPAAPKKDEYDTGEEKVLNVLAWSGYVPETILEKFEKQTGIEVNLETFESNEEMRQKLLSGDGSYDLIQPSEYVVESFIAEDLLRPIDHTAVSNVKNIAPEFRSLPFDPDNQYSVPWMAGTVGIIKNNELAPDPVTSFAEVFSGKYDGQIVVLDDPREIVSWALESLDLPINDLSEENLAQAKAVLDEWLPQVKLYDSASPKTALHEGNAAVGIVWNGEAAILLNQDPDKYTWALPEEGSHLFVDSLAIPKSATHPKNAELFMNFILRPNISQLISAEFPYLNPNAAAREALGPEALSNPASYPSDTELSRLQVFEKVDPPTSKAVEDLVTTIKIQ
ncbi:MAG: spermidine/putrescine ABC transporter substrate-binding protein [Chthoniobacterales bacterium]